MSELTWERFHRQNAALRALIDHEEINGQERDALLGFAEVFPEKADLLRALQQRWVTVLHACLDETLQVGTGTPEDDVQRAYRVATLTAPALRRLLDRDADHPALVELVEAEHQRIALAAGLAGPGRPLPEATRVVAHLSRFPRAAARRLSWWQRLLAA